MALKFRIKKLDEVAEAVRSLYRQDGEEYVLDVDGAVPKDKLDEFRNNNVELQKQIDKFKNVDPAKYQELMNLQQQIQEGELIKKGDVDGLVNLRVQNMKRDLETKLADAEKAANTANAQLSGLLIDSAAKSIAVKHGVHDTGLDDVVLRARTTYVMENGVPTPKGQDGKVIYGKDGTTPMPIEDWMVGLKKTAPHLFKGTTGSGAGGGNRAGAPAPANATPVQKIAQGLNEGGLMGRLPGAPN